MDIFEGKQYNLDELNSDINELNLYVENGCVDIISGFSELITGNIQVYPNPSTSRIYIVSESIQPGILEF